MKDNNKSKKNKVIIIAVALVIAVIVIFIVFIPASFISVPKSIQVEKGMSTTAIGGLLKGEGIIRSTFVFKAVSYIRGNKLQAGEYELNRNMSIWSMVGAMKHSKVKLYKVTVPEGYTLREIAKVLAQKGLADEKKFIKLTSDIDIIKQYKLEGNSMEGYLFPETYCFQKGTKEDEIINMMLRKFNQIAGKNNIRKLAEDKYIRFYDLIKLASIVEREAEKSEERPIIASIFLNRINKKMKLESCATIFYVLNLDPNKKKRTKLVDRDLALNSLYNTYKNSGLTPTPICNPGIQSILAVLNPADTKYLYFVSKNDGTHEFSKTAEEHMKAKKKYQQ